jgi:hypothetical protein
MSGSIQESKARRLATSASVTDVGLLITFLAPGFIGIVALSRYVPLLRTWPLTSGNSWTIGAFLFIALGALSFGVVFDAIRRACDPYLCGTVRYEPARLTHGDGTQLLLPEDRHRFYQFYGNMAVAVLIGGAAWLYQNVAQWLTTCDAGAVAGLLARVGGWAGLELLLLHSARQTGREFVYYAENVGVAQIDRSGVFREYFRQRVGDLERGHAHRNAGRPADGPLAWWSSVVRQLPWRGPEFH